MSRTQYLKSLERDRQALSQVINDLTRENYELRQLLKASARNPRASDEAKQHKDKAF